jgi:uncharacterized protein HemX
VLECDHGLQTKGRWAFNRLQSEGGGMSMRNQRGQTGIAVLALLVALVALGVSVYTYVQMAHNVELRSQMTKLQELSERGRQEMADALKRLEERIRGNQPGESPRTP